MRHYGPVYLALFVGLTLASALLASVAIYTATIEAHELERALAGASPAQRTLLLTGTRYTFSDALYAELQSKLGKVLEERIEIRRAILPADSGFHNTQDRAITTLDVYAFDDLPSHVRLVAGRLPEAARMSEATGYWPPPVEAVLGREAAVQAGYGLGDRVTANRTYHRLDIVGIVEPLDAQADWWGDELQAFASTAGSLALIIAPNSMKGHLGQPVFDHEVTWRLTLDPRHLRASRAEEFSATLVNLQTQLATRQARIDTGMVEILVDFQDRLSGARLIELLLGLQNAIFVFFVLTVLATLVAGHFKVQGSVLAARGSSPWQALQLPVLGSLGLALLAGLVLGPGLGLGAVALWAAVNGSLPPVLPGKAWLWAGLAAGLGWLIFSLAAYLATRGMRPGWEQMQAKPAQQWLVHKRYLDVFVLVLGGLLYWQLSRAGSVMAQGVRGGPVADGQFADPLLLLGPLLLMTGTLLVGLRVMPLLLGLLAHPAQELRGLVLPLGLQHLARGPGQPAQLVLLVSLAAGLALLAQSLVGPLAQPALTAHAGSGAQATALGGALQLNMLLVALLGVLSFAVGLVAAAEGRGSEMRMLQANGLSRRQGVALLLLEGAVVLAAGLLAGTAFAWGLAYLMAPFVMPAVAGSVKGAMPRAAIDWAGLAGPASVLVMAYVGVLAFCGCWWMAGAGAWEKGDGPYRGR
jgi:hypothetical protein